MALTVAVTVTGRRGRRLGCNHGREAAVAAAAGSGERVRRRRGEEGRLLDANLTLKLQREGCREDRRRRIKD